MNNETPEQKIERLGNNIRLRRRAIYQLMQLAGIDEFDIEGFTFYSRSDLQSVDMAGSSEAFAALDAAHE